MDLLKPNSLSQITKSCYMDIIIVNGQCLVLRVWDSTSVKFVFG